MRLSDRPHLWLWVQGTRAGGSLPWCRWLFFGGVFVRLQAKLLAPFQSRSCIHS